MCVCVWCSGVGGRLGTGSSLSSYVRKIIAVENVELDEDPREALLKYDKVSVTENVTTDVNQCHTMCGDDTTVSTSRGTVP